MDLACDVVVVGGGIAGVMAAWRAASAGARVALACAGSLFSGSSFFPGTWGLGLVGPESPEDEEDLVQTILNVGCGTADPELVRSFVTGITPAVETLEQLGVTLKRPANAGEREFIPCFDHKHRAWRGLRREAFEVAMGTRLREAGVRVLARHELVELVSDGGTICGALLFDHTTDEPRRIPCAAVVLATGGYGSLFERRLTPADALGCAQAVALRHGARLTNLEFMQIMPGLVSPVQNVVFNEKTFRMARLQTPDGRDSFPRDNDGSAHPLLALRSPYGPFTSRLVSRDVDLAIARCGDEGMRVAYPEAARAWGDAAAWQRLPEFVRTFFDWMVERGVTPADELRIAPYAHAANGGIAIDAHGWTGVPGLFACGECTGGMHGADRIGGLSSANGLVFGLRAGEAAARHAVSDNRRVPDWNSLEFASPISPQRASRAMATMRHVMSESCLVERDGERLARAALELEELEHALLATSTCEHDAADAPNGIGSSIAAQRLGNQLLLARCMVDSALARPESRGSHYRSDHPAEDAAFAHASIVTLEGTTPRVSIA